MFVFCLATRKLMLLFCCCCRPKTKATYLMLYVICSSSHGTECSPETTDTSFRRSSYSYICIGVRIRAEIPYFLCCIIAWFRAAFGKMRYCRILLFIFSMKKNLKHIPHELQLYYVNFVCFNEKIYFFFCS